MREYAPAVDSLGANSLADGIPGHRTWGFRSFNRLASLNRELLPLEAIS